METYIQVVWKKMTCTSKFSLSLILFSNFKTYIYLKYLYLVSSKLCQIKNEKEIYAKTKSMIMEIRLRIPKNWSFTSGMVVCEAQQTNISEKQALIGNTYLIIQPF